MYGRAEYLEIEQPDRIVYTQQFCDENENISRHPDGADLAGDDAHDREADRGRARPNARDRHLGSPMARRRREEMETFIKARGGMTQGWTGSFDKLEALVASR